MAVSNLLILDSCIWIALFFEPDSRHKKARKLFEQIKETVIIPEYVLIEIMNTLHRKAGKKTANGFLYFLEHSEAYRLQTVMQAELIALKDFFMQSPHEALSFVDHHLLFLSKKVKVLTFDQKLAKLIKSHPKL